MRPFPFVPLALACTLAVPAAGQTRSQANLVITILGGAAAGHPLWTVERQPVCVIGGGGACTSNYDTLRLSRLIGSSLVLGAAATYFPWPQLGFHGEVSYLGLPADNSCTGVSYAGTAAAGDSFQRNEQMCDEIRAQAGYGGAIAVFVGATVRATARGALSPFLRANVGFVNHSRSLVEVAGIFVDATGTFERVVISDATPRHTFPMVGLAAGFTTPLGPGYQFRLEVRDIVASLERVSGPANALAVAATDTRTYHHFGLALGFDVVLERSRGRRY